MRIDVKKVKGKKYLQFIDAKGRIYHIGPATDCDSWFISLFLWAQEWREEYYKRREEFFIEIESEMHKHVQLDAEKILAINRIKRYDGNLLHLPKIFPFGKWWENENAKRLQWHWNEWAIGLQKRLAETHLKRKKLTRKSQKCELAMEKERRLMELRDQSREVYENALEQMFRISEEKTMFLLSLKERGIVRKTTFVNELATKNKIPRAKTEHILAQLLREGEIYEPRKGYIKTT